MSLPTGTITFLFTDIEGSTRLWEEHPEAMRIALERHNTLLGQAIEAHNGQAFKTMGDAFCAAFHLATDAVAAALQGQQALDAEPWGETGPIRVRMALHTGEAEEQAGDYFGPPLNRVSRILSAGHGGQVLISGATQEIVQDDLPPEASLLDRGNHHLRDLSRPEHLFQLAHPSLPSEFPALLTLDEFTHNLPVQLTRFIGREQEIVELKQLLANTRLLTLTGTGGCGKTRLALQIAAEVLEDYPDGVWLVELAALSDPSLVAQTVASTWDLGEQAGRSIQEVLLQLLRSKHLLLVLDNCEHLVEACAKLVEEMLRAAPGLTILATSREVLQTEGETVWRVPSLDLPEQEDGLPPLEALTQYEAVQLFIERAVAAQSRFAVTNDNAPAVAQICWRLEGIPLALELAAARVKMLPVEQIAQRLDDRFRLLTGGRRTALRRHQTLQAALDWSYELLPEEERELLRRLSVFAGGWTLEAARAVCGEEEMEDYELLERLTQLVDKSLVVAEESGTEQRYRLSETVRDYNRSRLAEFGEEETLRTRHRDYFLGWAEEAASHLQRPDQREWVERLEQEHENLRGALEWSRTEEGGAEAGLRLGGCLGEYWRIRGHWTEGQNWLEEILARGREVPEEVRAWALNAAGILNGCQGEHERARAWFEESLALFRELGYQESIAYSLLNLGGVAYHQREYERARALFGESLTLAQELGDQGGIAYSLLNLGRLATSQGKYKRARELFQEGLTLFRELRHQRGIAYSLLNLGDVAYYQREYEQARVWLGKSLTLAQELGHQGGIAYALLNLGRLATGQGEYERAGELLQEGLTLARRIGAQWEVAEGLVRVADLCGKQGLRERGARLFGAGEALRENLGTPLSPSERDEYDPQVAAVRDSLDATTFTTAWAEGRAMSWEEAVAYALGEDTDEGQ